MQIYIVAVIIALVLISILFFALRSTVKRIDYNTKKYFIDKLQDYDYLIEEKQKILDDLNKEIEENKKTLSEFNKKDKKVSTKFEEKYYNDIVIPKYKDSKLFKKYKNIKQRFSIDYEETIKSFIKNKLTEDDSSYEILCDIRKHFSSEVVYELMNLKPSEQEKHIDRILDESESFMIKKYIKMDKFNINSFITELDTLIEKLDPKVYIYTGDKNSDYDFISDKIETIYDSSVNEGIRISYKGKLYDYSL